MPVERGSTTHGPHVDDQMRREVQGRLQGSESPRAEDWHEPEPAGEDQPTPDRMPGGHTEVGTPAGIDDDAVERRSRIATYLPYRSFPADREKVLTAAAEHNAPDDVLDELRRLPVGRGYQNVGEVWTALGHGSESNAHRG